MAKTNETLNQLQADATVFYQKLRAFHWTVTGERFFQLHEQFEKAYDRWAEHIDSLAERTVMNGGTPLLTLASVTRLAQISESGIVTDARAMLEEVVRDLRYLVDRLLQGARQAEEEQDRATAGLLEEIHDTEEKALWMLSASLS